MDEQQIARIKEYIQIINPNVEDNDMLNFCINEVSDRILLYLNMDTIPTKLERLLSKIINTGLQKCIKSMDNDGADVFINSISDNGQTISYTNEVKKYFATASDEELFNGVSNLISRYRRVNVVHPKRNA